MPFTTALRTVPVPPDHFVSYVDKDGRPTTDLFDHLKALQAWANVIAAALGQTGATVTVVGSLPSASGKTGVRYFVTDATVTTFMSTVVGGGASKVPVVSDGTNWKIG